jgi:hypothetical protein
MTAWDIRRYLDRLDFHLSVIDFVSSFPIIECHEISLAAHHWVGICCVPGYTVIAEPVAASRPSAGHRFCGHDYWPGE